MRHGLIGLCIGQFEVLLQVLANAPQVLFGDLAGRSAFGVQFPFSHQQMSQEGSAMPVAVTGDVGQTGSPT
jgi:hypothetical protein